MLGQRDVVLGAQPQYFMAIGRVRFSSTVAVSKYRGGMLARVALHAKAVFFDRDELSFKHFQVKIYWVQCSSTWHRYNI